MKISATRQGWPAAPGTPFLNRGGARRLVSENVVQIESITTSIGAAIFAAATELAPNLIADFCPCIFSKRESGYARDQLVIISSRLIDSTDKRSVRSGNTEPKISKPL